MKLEQNELPYLRRVVVERSDRLESRLERNKRLFDGTSDVELYETKVGCLEYEIKLMESIKQKINEEMGSYPLEPE